MGGLGERAVRFFFVEQINTIGGRYMNPNMANRDVCNLIFCEYKTKKPFLYADYANTTTTELTGESVHAFGGSGHPKRITFYGERGGTIAFETQIQPFKLYSLMTGADIENTASFVKREKRAAESGVITLDTVPIKDSVSVYALDDDCGTPIEITVNEKAITLTGESSSSDTYIVYYMETVDTNVMRLSIKSTTFPKFFTVYAETFNKTEDDEIVPYKMTAYKCAPQTNMSLSFSNTGDPATLTVTCDLLVDNDGNMLDMVLLETDSE